MDRAANHLILGGSGFIGRHVAVLLARAGHGVTIASRRPPSFCFPADVADRILWRPLDLASPDWNRLLVGADIVHHYAWTSIPGAAHANQAADLRINVGATIDLLDALRRRGCGRVIFASSGGTVYGKLETVPACEDHPLAPINAYGVEKATAELYLELYRSMAGLDCRIARIANPYGAGQDPARGLGVVTTLIDRTLNGRKIVVWGDGEIVRDFIHISDVAACVATLACAEATDEFVFNVGSGVGTSLNDVIACLERSLGRRLDVARTQPRTFDAPVNVLAIGRVRRELGWSPRLTLEQGMARTTNDIAAGRQFSTLDHWAPPRPPSSVTTQQAAVMT